jgi:hypothetical protein
MLSHRPTRSRSWAVSPGRMVSSRPFPRDRGYPWWRLYLPWHEQARLPAPAGRFGGSRLPFLSQPAAPACQPPDEPPEQAGPEGQTHEGRDPASVAWSRSALVPAELLVSCQISSRECSAMKLRYRGPVRDQRQRRPIEPTSEGTLSVSWGTIGACPRVGCQFPHPPQSIPQRRPARPDMGPAQSLSACLPWGLVRAA